MDKYKIIALYGESGSGKDTLLREAIKIYGDKIHKIVGSTTRPPRTGEENGVAYHFLTNEEFKALNSNYKGYNKEFYQDSYNAFIRPKIIKTGLLTFGITLLLCGLLAFIWLYEPKATENAKSKSTKKKR